MRSHPLIRHPVGKMPAAARWYLAGISVLTLLLIAIHFAIQVYAQQEARRLVNAWSESAGISVADVRYRMLRGALTLVDLRMNREDFQLYAPNLFLYGNLSSLTSSEPSVTRIEMRGLHVSLKAGVLGSVSDGSEFPLLFGQLWRSAQQVAIYDAKLNLLPDIDTGLPSQPVSLNLTRLHSKILSGERVVEALIYGLDGEARVVASRSLKSDASRFAGELVWSGMRAEPFLEKLLGMASMPGQLNGTVSWAPKSENAGYYSLSGEARFVDKDNGVLPSSKVTWNGVFEEGEWHGKLNGAAWPVAMFTDYAPQFQGRKLMSGNFSGAINFSGSLKKWQMGVVETYLDQIRYGQAAEEAGTIPEWQVEKVHVTKAVVQWPERLIDIKAAELINADFGFDAQGGQFSEPLWSIKAAEIGLNRVRPALHLSQGVLRVPEMKGVVSVKENHRMKLSLKSAASDGNRDEERWRIFGEGDWDANNNNRMAIEVAAENASLVRFRPLMPKKIRESATDLIGNVSMKLKLLAGPGSWEGRGGAELSTAALTYKGEQWQAEKIVFDFERVGSGIPHQLIRQLDVQGWKYQAALQPLDQASVSHDLSEIESDGAEPWHLKSLTLSDGEVAVGHKEAVWMDQITIDIENLKPDSRAPININGRLGGGSLSLKGDLLWDSVLPEITSAKISVRDVLPFFMNEWLQVSGVTELIRGRIYTDATIKRNADGHYKGMWYLRLQSGGLGQAASKIDPLLEKVGFNAFDIFSTLQNEGRIRLRIPIDQQGQLGAALGSAFVKQLNSEMLKKGRRSLESGESYGDILSSVRLHEKGTLSQNERVRLRKIILYLRENPQSSIELIPQFGGSSEGDHQAERSRYTQHLIEKFLNQRGIALSRIFPVRPGEEHRSSESVGGISIHTLQ